MDKGNENGAERLFMCSSLKNVSAYCYLCFTFRPWLFLSRLRRCVCLKNVLSSSPEFTNQTDIETHPFRDANPQLRLVGFQHPNIQEHGQILPSIHLSAFWVIDIYIHDTDKIFKSLLFLLPGVCFSFEKSDDWRLGGGGRHSCRTYWHGTLKSKHTTK